MTPKGEKRLNYSIDNRGSQVFRPENDSIFSKVSSSVNLKGKEDQNK